MDAVDAALVDFTERTPRLLHTHSQTIPDNLRNTLMELCRPNDNELVEMARADIAVANLFSLAVENLLQRSPHQPGDIIAIGSHGQTVRHHPELGFTTQIGDGNTLAFNTKIPTVCDFRRMDIAAGGQGAPLVPPFHEAVLSSGRPRAVINIGGMANITILSPDHELIGYDTGPGNALMNDWIYQHQQQLFDERGNWAASGQCIPELLEQLLNHPFIEESHPKSTGRETFNLTWLQETLAKLPPYNPQDVQNTLCHFTAQCIAIAVKGHGVEEVILCGGGVHNQYLWALLEKALALPTHSSAACGVDPDWLEAMAFAWLAKQRIEGIEANAPSVTGASETVLLGTVYQAQVK